MSEKQVRDYDKFMVRFPDGMRDAIAERAKRNGRSMNSEIVHILENALSGSQVGSVRIGFGESDFVEIDPSDHKSVINGLFELMHKLQSGDDNKKPT
ncbi:TPA: Arc family DNA-binding protein [Salmonella enterica subsp. enterica serovar Napoli]|nr:Arc family DNA-binding protein [Salmonella enterica subsp. enterica serovar Napoli]